VTVKSIIAIATGILMTTQAHAAEIKVLVSTAMKAPFEQIAAQFEKATGNTVAASFGPTGGIAKRVLDGEPLDLAILGGERVADLAAANKIVPFSSVGVARSAIGVGVRPGAQRPDISSEAGFKAALLGAKGIAVTDPKSGGGSSVFFARLFDRMGLTEALKPKMRYSAAGPGGYAGTLVMKGEADFALQPIPELMAVPGLEIVGPLPGAFQNITIYTATIPASNKAEDAAKALIKALTAPDAAAVYKAKGLEPERGMP
jgi:molybdate transport system substrate-binding protein